MRHEIDDREDPHRGALPRPSTPGRPSDRVREWIEWLGVARLVTSAIAVVAVCAGAWFLIRTPTPPPESALPSAAGAATVPPATLPVPVTVAGREGGATGSVVVHVAGAVVSPGVYELPISARVADAIEYAGGPTSDADPSAVNLAAHLVDGGRIYLPAAGEASPVDLSAGGSALDPPAGPPGPVDVNVADAALLETLPGVGPATAAAIVAERERHGPFVSVDDLERVSGIGPAKVAALAGLVVA